VKEYGETNSCTGVQRAFRKRLRMETGGTTGLRVRDAFVRAAVAILVSEEAVQHVEATFDQSPRKSAWKGSRELQIPNKTVASSTQMG
jgi:hypothetical protein